MRKPTRRTEVGRGERVLPGVWRMRLPLPWPVVPHCNAWALAADGGIVLVDCGMHNRTSLRDLEWALSQIGFGLEDVRLLVCTHAHADHCGQASVVVERSGCELWLHPRHEHLTASESMSGPLEPARDLLPGVVVRSDVGPWDVYETPGHAPSHIVLHQRERRLLISGDHVLGRISLYFDHGWTPDPVGEFLASLDLVEPLDVRLTLAGHGRPFTDLRGHVEGNRSLVAARLEAVRGALGARGEGTAHDLLPDVYGERVTPTTERWLLTKLRCYLDHLEHRGIVRRCAGEPPRWAVG
jgi:glyoxylase-like metal-dependent hydrolase (beta-lactamase superfamily II)